VELVGETAKATSVADVTVTVALLVFPAKLAVIRVEPLPTPLTTPEVCTTEPTAELAEDQLVDAVTSRVDPSL
jgi:hypothetical protein